MKCYDHLLEFTKKYPGGVRWRCKKHCAVIDKHLNPGEEIRFVIAGQWDDSQTSFFNTCVFAITNERIMMGQARVLFGYKFSSITPDLYNDMQVDSRIIWGILSIDTVKEKIYLSDIDKRALPEIETNITMFMQEAKKRYPKKED